MAFFYCGSINKNYLSTPSLKGGTRHIRSSGRALLGFRNTDTTLLPDSHKVPSPDKGNHNGIELQEARVCTGSGSAYNNDAHVSKSYANGSRELVDESSMSNKAENNCWRPH